MRINRVHRLTAGIVAGVFVLAVAFHLWSFVPIRRTVARLGGDTISHVGEVFPNSDVWFIGFRRTGVSDDDLLPLWALATRFDCRLDQVRELDLSGTRITDDTIGRLGVMTGLMRLSLSDTAVTGKSLEALRDLSGLYHLDLSRTQLSPDGIDQLVTLRGLQVLKLQGVSISSRDLEKLAAMDGLVSLDLSDSPIDDETLDRLAPLPRLEYLMLKSPGVFENSLKEIRQRQGEAKGAEPQRSEGQRTDVSPP